MFSLFLFRGTKEKAVYIRLPDVCIVFFKSVSMDGFFGSLGGACGVP